MVPLKVGMKIVVGVVMCAVMCTVATAQEANLDFVKSAVGENLVSSDYFASPDFKKLTVEIQTRGLDGGSMDFFGLGKDVLKLAEAIKANSLPVDYIDVMIAIPTLDKYGNSGTGDGGTITWHLSEIEKLNEAAPQYYLFELAHDVSLNLLGAEMADWYCQKWDMRDDRYCA